MAVTSIWPIKGRVDKVINYARNPEKTHDKERLSELHEIEGVVEYAADEMKTEKRAYMWKSMLPIRRMERLDPEKSNLKMVRSTRSTV